MRIIVLILGLTIMISCNSQSNNHVKIKKKEVLENIGILKTAGFFENYNSLSVSQIYDTIYSLRKREYSEIFKRPYDPGMELDAINLAVSDSTKVLFLDLEADVGKDNEVYIYVIKAFSQLSNNYFKPTEIKEYWESETGPIKVSFKSKGLLIEFEPEYEDDWLHGSVFNICEKEMKKDGIRIVDCLSDDGNGYGQAIALMRLSKEEQKVLESKLNWKFTSE